MEYIWITKEEFATLLFNKEVEFKKDRNKDVSENNPFICIKIMMDEDYDE